MLDAAGHTRQSLKPLRSQTMQPELKEYGGLPTAMTTRRLMLVASLLVLTGGCRRDRSERPPDAQTATGPRVVSLAPNLTEVVATIGAIDSLVGRTTVCDYPPELVGRIPVVGGFGAPSLETLLAVRPTLVIDVDLEDETMADTFRELGIRHCRVPCHRLADIPAAMRTIGNLTGHSNQAENLTAALERQLDAFRQQADNQPSRPRVYIEIWHDPIMTAGGKAFLSELIALAGGRNIAAAIDKEYFQASPEWVVEQNPDLIVCAYMSLSESVIDTLRRRPGWSDMRAVRDGLVFDGLDNDVMLRPGPRVAMGIALLQTCIDKARNHE